MSGTMSPVWAEKKSLQKTIPSYLYQEYSDDDDLQAFVTSYNSLSQTYVDWFNSANLPVYTSPSISGPLLDWVANGLYGQSRPVLPSGVIKAYGPLNTYSLNFNLPLNSRKQIGPTQYYATDDDVFKRCMTWNFYKGDGRQFNVRWLKRRIMRFLNGISGSDPGVNTTYQISITFGLGGQVNINLLDGVRRVSGGAMPNRFSLNLVSLNSLSTTFTQYTPLVNASSLAASINAAVLSLPFQYTYVISISGGSGTILFYNQAGLLGVPSGAGYPLSPVGLSPGSVWSNSGIVTVIPGVVPNPTIPPVYFGSVSPGRLLLTGGGDLPLSRSIPGSLVLWNNSGIVSIS